MYNNNGYKPAKARMEVVAYNNTKSKIKNTATFKILNILFITHHLKLSIYKA